MNYNPNETQNRNQGPYQSGRTAFPNPGQTFAMLAMILGAACFFTFFTVYLPIVFGSLAIILAVLSKGYGKKMLITAKVGMISAICCLSILLSIVVTLCSFLFTSDRATLTNMGQMLDTQIETQTGRPAEELLGVSYEDMMQQYADLLGK